MFLLVQAHPGCPGQNPESYKMVVVVVVRGQQLHMDWIQSNLWDCGMLVRPT